MILKSLIQLVAPLAFLRLYGGGGGDGGAGQMRQEEADRQRKVQAAVDAINAKFGVAQAPAAAPASSSPADQALAVSGIPTIQSNVLGGPIEQPLPQYDPAEVAANKTAREAMYSDISGAVKGTAMRDLDRQYSEASNRNTFGLARSGLMGGSVDAESGGNLKTLYGEGQLKADQAGLGAASDLRSTDEKTRQNLISLAQSGIDTGTASSLAAGQMAAAADVAKSQAATSSVGRLFDDMTQAYVNNQYMKARYPAGVTPTQLSGYGASPINSRYTGTVQK
jgi:hypothetical protein